MASIDGTLFVCTCCAQVVANADESSCRDYYGHAHPACSLPPHAVLAGEPDERARGFHCDGCNTWQLAFANATPVVVLV